MARKTKAAGTLQWVDVFSCTLNLIGKDGKQNIYPFDAGETNLGNYWKFIPLTSQQVECVLEDGVVKELSVAAQAPAR